LLKFFPNLIIFSQISPQFIQNSPKYNQIYSNLINFAQKIFAGDAAASPASPATTSLVSR